MLFCIPCRRYAQSILAPLAWPRYPGNCLLLDVLSFWTILCKSSDGHVAISKKIWNRPSSTSDFMPCSKWSKSPFMCYFFLVYDVTWFIFFYEYFLVNVLYYFSFLFFVCPPQNTSDSFLGFKTWGSVMFVHIDDNCVLLATNQAEMVLGYLELHLT